MSDAEVPASLQERVDAIKQFGMSNADVTARLGSIMSMLGGFLLAKICRGVAPDDVMTMYRNAVPDPHERAAIQFTFNEMMQVMSAGGGIDAEDIASMHQYQTEQGVDHIQAELQAELKKELEKEK